MSYTPIVYCKELGRDVDTMPNFYVNQIDGTNAHRYDVKKFVAKWIWTVETEGHTREILRTTLVHSCCITCAKLIFYQHYRQDTANLLDLSTYLRQSLTKY